MMDLLETSGRLAEHGVFLFFRLGKHFQDPQVPDEYSRLSDAGLNNDVGALEVAGRLVELIGQLKKGIYAPIPIARGLADGDDWAGLLERFRYAMIEVDEQQHWIWKGRPVAARIRSFFGDNIGWQPAIRRHFVEYRVSDDWFDKCYFDGVMTPLLATAFEDDPKGLRVVLSNGLRPIVDLAGLRLDSRERLYVQTDDLGEALCSEGFRFQVLKNVAEDLSTVRVTARDLPLIHAEPS